MYEIVFASVIGAAGAILGTAGIRSYALRESPWVGAGQGLATYLVALTMFALLGKDAGIEVLQPSPALFLGAGTGAVVAAVLYVGFARMRGHD